MISPDYCVLLARYNRWQNRCMLDAAETLPQAQRFQSRGAFWGSISGTLSHVLWGDLAWLSRFDGGARSDVPLADSADMFGDWGELRRMRLVTDARIVDWAGTLSEIDLSGDLFWYSSSAGRVVTMPKALCVTHFFNHQTHHRGQVHALLTAAGARTADTDLFLMPHEADWM